MLGIDKTLPKKATCGDAANNPESPMSPDKGVNANVNIRIQADCPRQLVPKQKPKVVAMVLSLTDGSGI
eukprot:8468387-Pyramimonas_sp.AAC.1